MKKEELVNYARQYIVEQLSNGFSLQDIKKRLMEFGYTDDVIKEALNYKEEEKIKELNDNIKQLRIENSYLKRDFNKLKEEKSGTSILLIIFLVILFSTAAFSFGFMFKDILKRDYIASNMYSNCSNINNLGTSNYGSNSNQNSNQYNENGEIILNDQGNSQGSSQDNLDNNLNSCSSLNGYLCDVNEICNGNLLNSLEDNCCSIQCEIIQCIFYGCNSINNILPCKCGTLIANFDNPWCCASSNLVFSGFQNENCIFCGGLLPPINGFE